jgi:hypothetical protein
MDEQQDNSMGMVIAVVAGGVILVLILLAALGAGFFVFRSGPAMPPGPGPVAMAAAIDEGPVAVEAAPPMVVGGPPPVGEGPPPAPLVEKEISPAAKRFQGEWESIRPDGTKSTMFFGVDGRLRFMNHPPDDEAPRSMMLRWELLESKGDRFKVRYTFENKVYDVEQEFEFQGNDRLVIHGPFRENDRWVVKGPDGTAKYQRKK